MSSKYFQLYYDFVLKSAVQRTDDSGNLIYKLCEKFYSSDNSLSIQKKYYNNNENSCFIINSDNSALLYKTIEKNKYIWLVDNNGDSLNTDSEETNGKIKYIEYPIDENKIGLLKISSNIYESEIKSHSFVFVNYDEKPEASEELTGVIYLESPKDTESMQNAFLCRLLEETSEEIKSSKYLWEKIGYVLYTEEQIENSSEEISQELLLKDSKDQNFYDNIIFISNNAKLYNYPKEETSEEKSLYYSLISDNNTITIKNKNDELYYYEDNNIECGFSNITNNFYTDISLVTSDCVLEEKILKRKDGTAILDKDDSYVYITEPVMDSIEYSEKKEEYLNELCSNILSSTNLSTYDINNFSKAISITIQTIPGTKFLINNNGGWIKIGSTGRYKISNCDITSLKFEYDSVINIFNNQRGQLIIDVEYEEE